MMWREKEGTECSAAAGMSHRREQGNFKRETDMRAHCLVNKNKTQKPSKVAQNS